MRIAVIEPRSSGVGLLGCARESGHEVVVLTAGHGDRSVPAEALAQAAATEVLDTNDDTAVLARLRVLDRRERLAAVLPGFEHYVPLAARAAAELGLPGLRPETAAVLRYKHLMRERLRAAGIDQPRHAVLAEGDDIGSALARVGLPCVVKPVDQSGSLNVRKAATRREAAAAVRRIIGYGTGYLDRAGAPLALVEEYVAGPEFSVEGYAAGGVPTVLCVTEKVLGPEPFFVEAGHMVPARLDPGARACIETYTRTAVCALGLTLGPFHAELRLSARGPLLMEAAARLPGDRIPDLVKLATGADLYAVTLACHLGLPPHPRPAQGPARGHAGVRFFLRPGLPCYQAMAVPPHIAADPAIVEVGSLIEPGRPVPAQGSSASRLGYAIALTADRQSTVQALDAAELGVRFDPAPSPARAPSPPPPRSQHIASAT